MRAGGFTGTPRLRRGRHRGAVRRPLGGARGGRAGAVGPGAPFTARWRRLVDAASVAACRPAAAAPAAPAGGRRDGCGARRRRACGSSRRGLRAGAAVSPCHPRGDCVPPTARRRPLSAADIRVNSAMSRGGQTRPAGRQHAPGVRAEAELGGRAQVVGGVDVAAQARPVAGQPARPGRRVPVRGAARRTAARAACPGAASRNVVPVPVGVRHERPGRAGAERGRGRRWPRPARRGAARAGRPAARRPTAAGSRCAAAAAPSA